VAKQKLNPRPATVNDVAKAAGVSKGTVSKVLNGRTGISPETRARVEAAAAELHFRPNPLARGLLDGRTGTVGLLTNDLEGRFSLPILMGAEDGLGAGELSVLLCDARGDGIRERYHLSTLLNRRIDGLLVVGDNGDPRETLGRDLPVPVVYALAPSSHPLDTSVVTDDVTSGEMAARHLISRGRTRITYVGGDLYKAAELRAEGARRALRQSGLDFVSEPVFGPWGERWGRHAADLLFSKGVEIDAVLCGSDHIARGVIDALGERGLRVPEDVAVMGHDNWEVLAAQSRPPLTTIDMNLQEIGKRAAQLLFGAIEGEESPGEHHVLGRVIVREST